ncbi:MAG: CocE/NonD family hydrolase [Proteobacteria bacterium]|jgi:putative CocE/NonD family hydrolase|nr:peptidase S15 [Chloroflexota bacterium]MCP4827847.1 CocE/NonD family hydrolase [Pseudomonadota bacterium]HJP07248.1 CocE/NonD family hydrolase [Arenicellales bacterium]|tara:strand:+ start:13835 stop:15871 length:2037 start_codon:yes stop_codon:yes gene_type:complete
MDISDLKVVHEFPRDVREIENTFIPLADGVRLAARIWMPEDADTNPVPAILEFLPYRKRDGTSERDALTHPYYAGMGYACVRVDMRGSGESDGILDDEYLKIEQDNALEVLQWITAQPWCSGNTGIIGISWGGFNGLQIGARRPPSLKAIVTIASTDDRYSDDIHYMGGTMINDNMSWGATMFAFNSRPPDPAIVGENWRDLWTARLAANDPWVLKWFEHQRRDEFWQHGSVCENYDDIECAVYAVGGWADGYSNAVPRLLANLKSPCKGLVGPWAHKYPHFALPGPRIGFLQETLRWWDYWLKGKETGIMDEPQYRVWMQDSTEPLPYYPHRPGRWVTESSWPSSRIKNRKLFLNRASLTDERQPSELLMIHTPQNMGTNQGEWCPHGLDPDGPVDQREDDGRSVTFDSAPLDAALEILGAPTLSLQLSSDKPNAFIVARINDVAPDGASTRVTYGVLNLTHRNDHEHPEALVPDEPYEIRLQLNDTAHAFKAGHRIRVSLSNTLWPLFWPSPEPVTLALETGKSQLSLPVRTDCKGDEDLAPFEAPQSARPESAKPISPDSFERKIERDDANGVTRLSVAIDSGMAHLTELGWEHGSVSRQHYEITDNEPNSNKAHLHWTTRFRRPEMGVDVRTETHSFLQSTPTEFHFSASLEAFEGENMVYSKNWEKKFIRDLN